MGDLEITINQDVVKGIVSEKIRLAVIEAMGGHHKMINNMVDSYLNTRVSNDGTISRYDSDNKYLRADILMRHLIDDALKEALKEVLQEKRVQIKESLLKYFSSKAGTSALAKAFSDGFVQTMSSDKLRYSIQVAVSDKFDR